MVTPPDLTDGPEDRTLPPEAGVTITRPARFEVSLENFTGPFDLLLSLIGELL